MSEVKQLFQCIVCGKAWPNKQALRAHMKAHKREGYMRTSVITNREKWRRFEEMCLKHKTTTCHLLGVLIEAALKGEELGVITVGSANPTIIQVNHVFLGKPRSPFKADFSQAFLERMVEPAKPLWPPSCEFADTFFKSTHEVGCKDRKEIVTLATCWWCYRTRGRRPL